MLDCIPFYKLSPTNHHYPDKRDSIKTELLLDLKENIPSCISGKKNSVSYTKLIDLWNYGLVKKWIGKTPNRLLDRW